MICFQLYRTNIEGLPFCKDLVFACLEIFAYTDRYENPYIESIKMSSCSHCRRSSLDLFVRAFTGVGLPFSSTAGPPISLGWRASARSSHSSTARLSNEVLLDSAPRSDDQYLPFAPDSDNLELDNKPSSRLPLPFHPPLAPRPQDASLSPAEPEIALSKQATTIILEETRRHGPTIKDKTMQSHEPRQHPPQRRQKFQEHHLLNGRSSTPARKIGTYNSSESRPVRGGAAKFPARKPLSSGVPQGRKEQRKEQLQPNSHAVAKAQPLQRQGVVREPRANCDKEAWQIYKDALRQKFPGGWNPHRKLSPDAMEGVRALHSQYPDHFTTPVLASHFKMSPEAIRRILKSKWRPSGEEEEDRRRRWDRRGEKIWTGLVEQGVHPPKRWREMGIGGGPRRKAQDRSGQGQTRSQQDSVPFG